MESSRRTSSSSMKVATLSPASALCLRASSASHVGEIWPKCVHKLKRMGPAVWAGDAGSPRSLQRSRPCETRRSASSRMAGTSDRQSPRRRSCATSERQKVRPGRSAAIRRRAASISDCKFASGCASMICGTCSSRNCLANSRFDSVRFNQPPTIARIRGPNRSACRPTNVPGS